MKKMTIYSQQYEDLKLFFREYVDEPTLNHLISYTDMKTKYPIAIIDLRHPVDHITPEKNSRISRLWHSSW